MHCEHCRELFWLRHTTGSQAGVYRTRTGHRHLKSFQEASKGQRNLVRGCLLPKEPSLSSVLKMGRWDLKPNVSSNSPGTGFFALQVPGSDSQANPNAKLRALVLARAS